jgi:hypothetical protein
VENAAKTAIRLGPRTGSVGGPQLAEGHGVPISNNWCGGLSMGGRHVQFVTSEVAKACGLETTSLAFRHRTWSQHDRRHPLFFA